MNKLEKKILSIKPGFTPHKAAQHLLATHAPSLNKAKLDATSARLTSLLTTRLGVDSFSSLPKEAQIALPSPVFNAIFDNSGATPRHPVRWEENISLRENCGPIVDSAIYRQFNELSHEAPLPVEPVDPNFAVSLIIHSLKESMKRRVSTYRNWIGMTPSLRSIRERVTNVIEENPELLRVFCAIDRRCAAAAITTYFEEYHPRVKSAKRLHFISAVWEGLGNASFDFQSLRTAYQEIYPYAVGETTEYPKSSVELVRDQARTFVVVKKAFESLLSNVDSRRRSAIASQKRQASLWAKRADLLEGLNGPANEQSSVPLPPGSAFGEVEKQLEELQTSFSASQETITLEQLKLFSVTLETMSYDIITTSHRQYSSAANKRNLISRANNLLENLDSFRHLLTKVHKKLLVEKLTQLKSPNGSWRLPPLLVQRYGEVLSILTSTQGATLPNSENLPQLNAAIGKIRQLANEQDTISVNLPSKRAKGINAELFSDLQALAKILIPPTYSEKIHHGGDSIVTRLENLTNSVLILEGTISSALINVEPKEQTLAQFQITMKKLLSASAPNQSRYWKNLHSDISLTLTRVRDHLAHLNLQKYGFATEEPYCNLNPGQIDSTEKQLTHALFEMHKLFNLALELHTEMPRLPLLESMRAIELLGNRGLEYNGMTLENEAHKIACHHLSGLPAKFKRFMDASLPSQQDAERLESEFRQARKLLPDLKNPFLRQLKLHLMRMELGFSPLVAKRRQASEAATQGIVDAQFSRCLEMNEAEKLVLETLKSVSSLVQQSAPNSKVQHELDRAKHYFSAIFSEILENRVPLEKVRKSLNFGRLEKHIARLENKGNQFEILRVNFQVWLDAIENQNQALAAQRVRTQKVEATLRQAGLRNIQVFKVSLSPTGAVNLEINRSNQPGKKWVRLSPLPLVSRPPKIGTQLDKRPKLEIDKQLLSASLQVLKGMNQTNRLNPLWQDPQKYAAAITQITGILHDS